MKIFIIIDGGYATVYADSNKAEVETIDLDILDEDHDRAEERAQEIAATYVRIG